MDQRSRFIGFGMIFNLVSVVILLQGAQRVQSLSTEATNVSNEDVESIYKCYNELEDSTPTSFYDYMKGTPIRSMRIGRIWWSPRKHTLPLSVYTSTDLNRLDALEAQCRSFPGGIISAAAYLPLYEPLPGYASTLPGSETGGATTHEQRRRNLAQSTAARIQLSQENAAKLAEAEAKLDAFFQEIERSAQTTSGSTNGQAADGSSAPAGICTLRLMLLYETVAELPVTALFPANSLRNAAMLGTSTPLVIMLDVDFSLNRDLVQHVLTNPKRVAQMVKQGEEDLYVWVVPAWETGHNLTKAESIAVIERVRSVPHTDKRQLESMWLDEKAIAPFHADVYLKGHIATNLNKWFRANEAYRIHYQKGYEPWVIASRKTMPTFDPRYRGFGFNKIDMLTHLASTGYRFYVSTDAWCIHRPHEYTVTRGMHVPMNGTDGAPPPSGGHTIMDSAAVMDLDVRVGAQLVKARDAFVNRNYAFYVSNRDRRKGGSSTPTPDAQFNRCRSVLTWWRDR